MKVSIGKYPSYIGPYQVAEFLCFWAKEETNEWGFKQKPEFVHHLGFWLAHGKKYVEPTPDNPIRISEECLGRTWFAKALSTFNKALKRDLHVRVDPWDTGNVPFLLASVIAPVLRRLIDEADHGWNTFRVDSKDLPADLRTSDDTDDSPEKEKQQYLFVLREMLYAMEEHIEDKTEDFTTGTGDWQWRAIEWDSTGKATLFEMFEGPNHDYQFDNRRFKAHQKRVINGMKLFAKYFGYL